MPKMCIVKWFFNFVVWMGDGDIYSFNGRPSTESFCRTIIFLLSWINCEVEIIKHFENMIHMRKVIKTIQDDGDKATERRMEIQRRRKRESEAKGDLQTDIMIASHYHIRRIRYDPTNQSQPLNVFFTIFYCCHIKSNRNVRYAAVWASQNINMDP